MEKSNARGRLALLNLLLIFYALAGQVVHAESEAPFRLLRERLVSVPVYINGEGPFDFLLDTGTNTTLVAPDLAARLGLRFFDRMALVTVAGERVVPRARLSEVTLGGRSASDVEALVCDMASVRALDARLGGVLGQNFLSRFNYALRFDTRRLEFEDSGESAWRGTRVNVEQDDGRLIVSARMRGRAEAPLRLALDSAATAFILFGQQSENLAFAPASPNAMRAVTNAGSRPARIARLRSLYIGTETFKDLAVALIDEPAGVDERAEDGLLPTSLFRAVYFNHSEGYVIFNPRRADE
jgi:predicted aspartyl protease